MLSVLLIHESVGVSTTHTHTHTHTHTQQFIPFVNIISTKFSQEETYSNQICKLGVSMFTQQILYTVHLLGWVPESNDHCKFTAEYLLIINSNPSVIVKHFINLKSTCSLQHTQYENWIYCIYILDP